VGLIEFFLSCNGALEYPTEAKLDQQFHIAGRIEMAMFLE
jgi:hypothetical protein